jgi:hypothetical protein
LNTTPVSPAARRSPFKWYLLGFVAALLALGVLYTMFMLWWSYSDGERAGVLQKFSERGWVCKTYEGELALYVVAGVAPTIWNFSVRDAAVAAELGKHVGQNVRLHYREHRGLPTNCFGETDYFVDRLEVIGPPPLAATVPSQAVAPTP